MSRRIRKTIKPQTKSREPTVNYFLILFLAFFAGVALLRPGFLQGAPVTSTQANWHVATSGASATLPVAASYNIYDSKDAGIVAGEDIRLQSTAYTATQTSGTSAQTTADTGAGDTCSSGSCSIGGGFNAGTKTDVVVSGTGADSSLILTSSGYPAGVTVKVSEIKEGCTGTLFTDTCFGSISAWEAAQQRDLVAANEIEVAKIDGAWTTADTTAVVIDGWITDATHYIRIYTTPSARHQGKWDTNKYRLEIAEADGIKIAENYVRIKGLQVKISASTNARRGIALDALTVAGTDVRISHNIISGLLSDTANNCKGIEAGDANTTILKIWNNVVYDFINATALTSNSGIRVMYAPNIYVYNNTVYNSYIGYALYGATPIAKNNIAYNNTDNWDTSNGPWSGTNNLSGPGSDTGIPLTGARDGVTVTFSDANNDDFRLASGDTGAKTYGADLSADANLAFNTDVEGYLRSGTWDIGADEEGAAAIPSSSGAFTSATIDLGGAADFSTFSFNQTITGGAFGKGWGRNNSGQLGDGTTTQSLTPVSVLGLNTITAVAASIGGDNFSLAILSDGTIKSWGYNTDGQLGNGTTTQSLTPVSVSGITNAVAIAAGTYHALALLSDGTIKGWGWNGEGELGDGTGATRTSPVTAGGGISNAVAIAAGGSHSLVLLADGTIRAFGGNGYGQLGNGATAAYQRTPVSVSGITNAVAIAAGGSYDSIAHSLAILADGRVMTWGDNTYGQLGDGTTTGSLVPVFVSGITNAVAVAAGVNHSLALLSDGTVMAWGRNNNGQLGNNSTTDSLIPVAVTGVTNAVAVAAGSSGWSGQSVSLLSDGTVKAWGNNGNGQLGDGTTTQRLTPVSANITNATAVAAGAIYTLAITGGTRFQIAVNNDNATWNYSPLLNQIGHPARRIVPASFDNSRYVRYKAYLATSDTAETPFLNDVTVNYAMYPVAAATLTSSRFDTGTNANFIARLIWTEDWMSDGTVTVSLRSSADGASFSGFSDYNNADADCSGSGTITCVLPLADAPADAASDQWFQYRVSLASATGGATPAVDDINIEYDTAHLEVFAPDGTSGSYTPTAGTSFNVTVLVKDSSGTLFGKHSGSRQVQLTASAAQPNKGGCTSSFNGGTTYTSTPVFSAGSASIPVTLCDASVAGFTISAQETSLGALTSTVSLTISAVNPDSASKQLAFTTQPAATATAGVNWTTQPAVSVQDQFGNVFTTATDSITLAAVLPSDGVSPGGGTLGAATNPLSAAGGSAAFAGVNYTKSEDIRLRASATGLANVLSSTISVGPAAAAQASLSAPVPVTAGSVSGAFTLTSLDAFGNIANAAQNTVFNLSSSSGGTVTFYSDAAGTLPVTQATISSATSGAVFYYRDTRSGAATVTAAASTGDALGSASATITVNPAPAAQASLSAPASVTAGSVSGAFTLTSRDASGNAAGVTQNTVFNLSSDSTGTVAFYSDAAGTTPVTQATISIGTSSAVFYYKDTMSGVPAVTATVVSGDSLGSTGATITVNPGPAIQLVISTSPFSVVAGGSAGAVNARARDTFGNIVTGHTGTVSLSSSSSTMRFYPDMATANADTYTGGVLAGTGAVTSVTLSAGQKDFWFRDTTASAPTHTITASLSTSDTIFQTSDTGAGDTPNAGGFNAGTKTQTVVSGSGAGASVGLAPNTAQPPWTSMSPAPATVTIASLVYAGSGDFIYAFVGNDTALFYRYSISGNSWSAMTSAPAAVGMGSALVYPGTGDFIYAFRGGNSNAFWRYSISGNVWTTAPTITAAPGTISGGGSLVYPGSGDFIYALRGGSGAGTTDFYRYSISGNTWTSMAVTPAGIGGGGSLVYPGSGDFIYVVRGAGTTDFYSYSISGNSWTTLSSPSNPSWLGGALVYPGSGDYIYSIVDGTTYFLRYSISTDTWTPMAALPGRTSWGALVYPGSGDYIYGLRSDGTTDFYRYSMSSAGGWTTIAQAPADLSFSSNSGNLVYPASGDFMYALRGGGAADFWRYSVSGNAWTNMSVTPATMGYDGAGLVYPGSGNYIYAARGDSATFYRYSVSGNSWASMNPMPGAMSYGGCLAAPGSGGFIYALRGNATDFYRYSVSGNSWTVMAPAPGTIQRGAALAYPGSGDFLYAFQGNSTVFYRYSISGNVWATMAPAPAAIFAGGSLVYPGSGDYIYAAKGDNTQDFYRYSISGNSWTSMPAAPGRIVGGGSLAAAGVYVYALAGSNSQNSYSRDFYRFTLGPYFAAGTHESQTLDLGAGAVPGYTTLSFNAASTDNVPYLEGEGYPAGVAVEEWTIRQDAVNAATCNTTNRACNSLASWEDAADGTGSRDLTASGEDKIVVAKIDGPWTSPDTTFVEINGWTTDATHYIKIYTTAAARHQGKWDSGKYRLEILSDNYCFVNYISYTRIDGLQIQVPNYTWRRGIMIQGTGTTGVKVSNNIIKAASGSAQYRGGIGYSAGTSAPHYIWNNIMYDFSEPGGYGINGSTDSGVEPSFVYNNTVVDCLTGISSSESGGMLAKNNLVSGGTTQYYSWNFASGSDYNVSSGSASTGGANDKINQTVSLVDTVNKDFRLAVSDTAARNAGADLSLDASLAFSTDNEGYLRPAGAWDIGADEEGNAASVKIQVAANNDNATWSYLDLDEEVYPAGVTIHTSYIRQLCAGYNPCYNSLSAWEAAQQRDLVASNEIEVAKIDGSWTTADTTAVTIQDWTTGPNNYIKIHTTSSARHQGKWDTGKYRLGVSNNYRPFVNFEDYVRIDGLQISNDTAVDYGVGMLMRPNAQSAAATDIRISNNIIRTTMSNTGISGIDSGYGALYKIWNNVIYDFPSSGVVFFNGYGLSTAYLYNNTFYNNSYGINLGSGTTAIAKNNIVTGSNAYVGTFAAGTDYNATDGTDNIGQGSNNKISRTFSFVDATNRDLRLVSSDTGARNAGADLSADANLAIDTDVEGYLRSGTWDIGADEEGATTSPVPQFIPPSLDGMRYFRYKAAIQTGNPTITPLLNDVTVSYYASGTNQAETVTPGAAASLVVSGIADTVAGTASSVTVTAYDSLNNITAGYTGTVSFSSSDPQANLPGAYTFTSGDAGAHTFTNGVTLRTAGTQSVTAADGALSGTQSNITVTPASLSALDVVPPGYQAAQSGAAAGVRGNAAVSFTVPAANPVPGNGRIVVTFAGAGNTAGNFSFNSGGTTAAAIVSGLDGTLSVSNITGQAVTVDRVGGTGASGTVSVTLSNVRTPSAAFGSTGNYSIQIQNSSGGVMAEDTAVAPDNIFGVIFSSPLSSTQWSVGDQNLSLAWSESGTSNNFVLQYYNGAWSNAQNDGANVSGAFTSGGASASWDTNSGFIISSSYRIRVYDTTLGYSVGESDAFTMRGGLALSAPAGGAKWSMDAPHQISWTTTGTFTSGVRLSFSSDSTDGANGTWTALSAYPTSTDASASTNILINADNNGITAANAWWLPSADLANGEANLWIKVSDANTSAPPSSQAAAITVSDIAGVDFTLPDRGATAVKAGADLSLNITSVGVTNVTIEYKSNAGAGAYVICQNASAAAASDILVNGLPFVWRVPDDVYPVAGADIRVSASASSAVEGALEQTSAGFTIYGDLTRAQTVSGTYQVNDPNNRVPVVWSGSSSISAIIFEYNIDAVTPNWQNAVGVGVGDIYNAATGGTAGTYNWAGGAGTAWWQPKFTSGGVYIRVVDTNDAATYSPANLATEAFSISGISVLGVTATSSSGDITYLDTLTVGTTRYIKGTGATQSGSVNIYYDTTPAFTSPVPAGAAPLISGAYARSWTVPDVISETVYFKVTDPSNESVVYSISAAPVSIKGGLTVDTPGSAWVVGSTAASVTGTVTGDIDVVDLQYTTAASPAETDWANVAAGLSIGNHSGTTGAAFTIPAGSFTVPDAISAANFKIRVKDATTGRAAGLLTASAASTGFQVKGLLAVASPAATDTWHAGRDATIGYNATGSGLGNFRIYYGYRKGSAASDNPADYTFNATAVVNTTDTAYFGNGTGAAVRSYAWSQVPDVIETLNGAGADEQDPSVYEAQGNACWMMMRLESDNADTVYSQGFRVGYYKVTWRVKNLGGAYLATLNVSEPVVSFKPEWNVGSYGVASSDTGSTLSYRNAGAQDFDRYYPYYAGTYSTTLTEQAGGVDYPSTVTWMADSDKIISIYIDTEPTVDKKVVAKTSYQFETGVLNISSWLESKGLPLTAAQIPGLQSVEVRIYDAADAVNPISPTAPLLGSGLAADTNGVYWITWNAVSGGVELQKGRQYLIKSKITYNGVPYEGSDIFTLETPLMYSVQIDPAFTSVDKMLMNVSLLRSGVLVSDLAAGDLTNLIVFDDGGTDVSGNLNVASAYTTLDTAGIDQGIYHTSWNPVADLSSGIVYTIVAQIAYKGNTYSGTKAVSISGIDGKIDAVQTSIGAATDAGTASTLFGRIAAVKAQTAAIQAETDKIQSVKDETDKITTQVIPKVDTLQATVDAVKLATDRIGVIEQAVTTDLPQTITNAVTPLLAAERKLEVLTRSATVKPGTAMTIRCRNVSGAPPALTVYNPGGAPVFSQAMAEASTTGIYSSAVTFAAAWGTGDFSVVCSESSKIDSIVVNVQANDFDTIFAQVNAMDTNVASLITTVNTIHTNTTGVSTNVGTLLARLGSPSDTSAAATLFGKVNAGGGDATAALSAKVDALQTSLDAKTADISAKISGGGTDTILSRLAALKDDVEAARDVITGYVDEVESSVGSSSDTADSDTVFGKISGMEGLLASVGADATNAVLYAREARAQAMTINETVADIRASLGEGDINAAVQRLGDLGGIMVSLQESMGKIPDGVGTQTLLESIQETLDNLKGMAETKGYGDLVPAMTEEFKPVNPEDVNEIRNNVSGLKSLMLEIRGLLDKEVNKPIVHGWLEETE